MASMIALNRAINPLVPTRQTVVLIGIGLGLGVVAPIVAQQLGLTSPTFLFEADGFRLVSIGFGHRAWIAWLLVGVFAVSTIVISLMVGHRTRLTNASLRHKLQVQTWQLAQLVSEAR
jgi:hypothetical protein